MAFSYQLDTSDIDQCPKFSQFTQLDVDERDIRLIRLRHDIKVETYPLPAAPPYYAISYFWGPPTPSQQIRVEGEFVEMRETVSSLFEVLPKRYGDETLFWIDILCIDQRNLSERNSQVSMMCDIYSRAIGVISWLGQSNPLSQNAFQIVEKRILCPENAPMRMWDISQKLYSFDVAQNKWPTTQQLVSDRELFSNFAEVVVWPSLADILRRPYWNRLWVMQEIIVAEKVTLLCGTSTISLDDFGAVCGRWIWQGQYFQPRNTGSGPESVRTSSYQDVINTWRPIEKISEEYRKQYKEDKILLMELVDSFASKQCSNIRDKVFGLRSLSKEAATIKVDYSKAVLEVFLSLVQSGLLMSDGGRGFQSLPHLIRCMGIDYNSLNEQLANLPRTVIPLWARQYGTVVTTKRLEHDVEAGSSDQAESFYVRVVPRGKDRHAEHFRSSRANVFLQKAQRGDILCTIQLASPILLLLRPHERSEAGITYEAVENLHDWGFEWDPAANLPVGARIMGEIHILQTSESDGSQSRHFAVESHSLRGLTLWKATIDKWYF